jgi:hypothetical protein
MTTKNIIKMPCAVINTFQRCPFGVQVAALSAINRAPSIHIYCTPGCISSKRIYMVKQTEIKPTRAETIRYKSPMSLWFVDMNQRVKKPRSS